MALTLTNVRGGRPPSEIKLAKPEAHDAPFFTGEFSGVVYQVRVRQQWRRFSLASHVVLTDRNCGQCASLYCGCAWTPKLGGSDAGRGFKLDAIGGEDLLEELDDSDFEPGSSSDSGGDGASERSSPSPSSIARSELSAGGPAA